MELDKICNFHNTAEQFVFVCLSLCICIFVFVFVYLSEWGLKSFGHTLAMLWQKAAGKPRTLDYRRVLSSLTFCHRLSSFVLRLRFKLSRPPQSRSQPSEKIRRDFSLSILNILSEQCPDFYWGQDPRIWGRKQVFCIKVECLAFAWGSQPIEAAHQMWQNLKAGDRKACIMRALIWEMGARNGA